MYISAKHLNGFRMISKGESLGRLTDLFFDDLSWTIRYMVVETGSWLVGRRVLLSASAIEAANPSDRIFHTSATKRQVEDSPGIDILKPVSADDLEEIHKHYGWPAFQVFPTLSPMIPLGFLTPPTPYNTPDTETSRRVAIAEADSGNTASYCFTTEASARAGVNDVHLRSTNEVEGYRALTQDGALGHIQDFLVDESDWTIRYAVVDTRNWIRGRVVLLPTTLVTSVDWQDSAVHTSLAREQLLTAPEYDHTVPLSPEDERRLREHYGIAAVRF